MHSAVHEVRAPRAQRGAILVTSMLLLLVLTIIGITAMQMTRMQERMAGNTRDRNLALQAAEGALRDAEALVAAQQSRPITCDAAPCDFWEMGVLPIDLENSPALWWDANARTYGTPDQDMTDLAEDPASLVEEYLAVRIDGGVVQGEPPAVRDFYVITARSTGGSGDANVVLQTTYTRMY
jgi:type IV pilus assembly protein PilX